MTKYIISFLLLFHLSILVAQEEAEEAEAESDVLELPGVDMTLLHKPSNSGDSYGQAIMYYPSNLFYLRRGLNWWIAQRLLSPIAPSGIDTSDSERRSLIRLGGSTSDYLIRGSARYVTLSPRGWNFVGKVDAKWGRDLYVEGLFREEMWSSLQLSRDHLTIEFDLPISTRGLQSSASEEVVTLTGNNLYNPSWGLYSGEVRNSRVRKNLLPSLSACYERPLGRWSTLFSQLNSRVGRRSESQLGWYDAYNPSPDYYRKLPSYITTEQTRTEVEQLWRDEDIEYTQIAWDDLVLCNQRSADGSAYYLLEDEVELVREAELEAIFTTALSDRVNFSYGFSLGLEANRYFKLIDDLLGAEYHYDYDLYIGDDFHLGNDMNNDLRNPDRKVGEGERFGYDYTLRNSSYALTFGIDYRSKGLSISLWGEFAEQYVTRVGHYEKERFAGSLSYGESSTVSMNDSRVDLSVGYSPNGRHHLSLRGRFDRIPLSEEDLFLQVESANRIIDNPESRSVGSVNLGYRYEWGDLALDVDGYVIYSRDQTQVWSYYDDMSYTYSNVVARGIGTRSIGLEMEGRYRPSQDLEVGLTLAMGDYRYDTTPEVTLYDDSDMSLLSTSSASAIEGCNVGNMPQILAMMSLDYFAGSGLILSFDCYYGGGRYLSPSIVRRTDRMVLYASSSSFELANNLISQELMPGLFDAQFSVVKSFFFCNGSIISLNLRIDNLLGDRSRIEYGRESSRILTSASGSYSTARYLQSSLYQYSTPRSYYLSCSYQF